jgi:hypothetical protein
MLDVYVLCYELYNAQFVQVDEILADFYLLNTGCL